MISNPFSRGQLEKFVIRAYDNQECSGTELEKYNAFLNPAEFTLNYEVEYYEAQGAGTTASRMDFKRIKPRDISLSFFIDGTGTTGKMLNAEENNNDVKANIDKFFSVTGFKGEQHRTNYLKINWGQEEFKCALKSASVAYKLFKSDGSPLRAVINAVFSENLSDQERVANEDTSSPDLTHIRIVKEGDTLPLMTYRIYGDPSYYLKVAQANAIDNFTKLIPGQKIFFPPLDKFRKNAG